MGRRHHLGGGVRGGGPVSAPTVRLELTVDDARELGEALASEVSSGTPGWEVLAAYVQLATARAVWDAEHGCAGPVTLTRGGGR